MLFIDRNQLNQNFSPECLLAHQYGNHNNAKYGQSHLIVWRKKFSNG
jgi:hypothetical protein